MENENEMKIVMKSIKIKTTHNTQNQIKPDKQHLFPFHHNSPHQHRWLASWLAGWLVVCILPKTNFV